MRSTPHAASPLSADGGGATPSPERAAFIDEVSALQALCCGGQREQLAERAPLERLRALGLRLADAPLGLTPDMLEFYRSRFTETSRCADMVDSLASGLRCLGVVAKFDPAMNHAPVGVLIADLRDAFQSFLAAPQAAVRAAEAPVPAESPLGNAELSGRARITNQQLIERLLEPQREDPETLVVLLCLLEQRLAEGSRCLTAAHREEALRMVGELEENEAMDQSVRARAAEVLDFAAQFCGR